MLQGVTVLDLTTSIAGPYATMLLSDFGAEVIKIERPGGDDAREWGPPFLGGDSLWFLAVNRNKRSVCIDCTSPRGRQLLEQLLDQADVLVTNQLADAQQKLGIDAASLCESRHRLIHVSVTGFGMSGRNARMACYDLIAEGYSGIMDLTGTAESKPQKIGAPAADMLAGSDAAMTVMAALFRRSLSGKGCRIDITLTESAVRFMSARIVPYLGSGEVPRRSGGRDSVIAIYQTFDTADVPITLALGNDAIWERFWNAVGQPHWGQHEDWRSNVDRRRNREEIVTLIQEILRERPSAEWLALFAASRVPAGPIYRVDEVVADAHFRDRSLFFQIQRDGHAVPQVGLGVHVDGESAGYFSPPPRLGEHTTEVLSERLQLSGHRLEELLAAGVIVDGSTPTLAAKEG
jgi:crotonobetainyl-CoA:carnitine CoA-transferase CaiB-like acyl-CoA transferase